MSHFIRKFVPHFIHSNFNRLFVLQLSSLHLQNANNDSFTVKHLIDTCGFSPDKAVSASNYINFDNPDGCLSFIIFNRCIAFLKTHGFTNAHLFKLLTTCPRLVSCDPQNTLLPTIRFLHSKGFNEAEIPALLMLEPDVFDRSLEEFFVPAFNLLRDYLGSENVIRTIRRSPMVLLRFQDRVLPNIRLLKEAGVSKRCIAFGLNTQPGVFVCSCYKLEELVEGVVRMGIEPRSWQFISAVCSMGSLKKLTWKNKLEVYRRWGCSEEEVLMAFKKVPRCMRVSEEKIDGVMNFFVHEMGWTSQMVLLTPKLFTYSLQKRIVPRCSVYKLLVSKGLVKAEGSLYTVVTYPEDKFLEKFINCYREEAPELLRLYEEKMKNSVNGYNSEDEFPVTQAVEEKMKNSNEQI